MRKEVEKANVAADMEERCTCGKIANVAAATGENDVESRVHVIEFLP